MSKDGIDLKNWFDKFRPQMKLKTQFSFMLVDWSLVGEIDDRQLIIDFSFRSDIFCE